MRKELAKLCLDIVKYIITAVIISGLFSGIEENWAIYLVATILVTILFFLSSYLMNNKKTNKFYVSTNYRLICLRWHHCRMGCLFSSPRQQES